MHQRTLSSLASAGLFATACATAVAVPGTGVAAPPSSLAGAAITVSADTLSALQRDLGLTATEARARLGREATAARLEPRLRKTLGAAYGGAWLTADATALMVAVTDSSKAATVRTAGARPVVVARSERTLTALKDALDQRSAPASIPGWYVDPSSNSVVVLARPGAPTAALVAGLDPAAIRIVPTAAQPRPLLDVRGGDAYYTSQYRCSIGFSVTRGYVTAGHCGSPGENVTGYNREAQGTFRGSSFPGNDYAWIETNANWTPKPWVNRYNGTNITVNGNTEAAVGASICRSGSTTQWRCGTVRGKNETVNYPEGRVSGLTRTNACAEGGDSGGSFIAGDQAQGVTSGGSGNCSSGGETFFQPLNEILSVYGLTLVTGDGTPPPTGCQGYEENYTGSLSGSGNNQYQPNGSYYQSTVSGTHAACLDGPDGVDFDLYLQKWNGSSWANVATSDSPNPDEKISYSGTAGYYRYRVNSYSGSGSYKLGMNTP